MKYSLNIVKFMVCMCVFLNTPLLTYASSCKKDECKKSHRSHKKCCDEGPRGKKGKKGDKGKKGKSSSCYCSNSCNQDVDVNQAVEQVNNQNVQFNHTNPINVTTSVDGGTQTNTGGDQTNTGGDQANTGTNTANQTTTGGDQTIKTNITNTDIDNNANENTDVNANLNVNANINALINVIGLLINSTEGINGTGVNVCVNNCNPEINVNVTCGDDCCNNVTTFDADLGAWFNSGAFTVTLAVGETMPFESVAINGNGITNVGGDGEFVLSEAGIYRVEVGVTVASNEGSTDAYLFGLQLNGNTLPGGVLEAQARDNNVDALHVALSTESVMFVADAGDVVSLEYLGNAPSTPASVIVGPVVAPANSAVITITRIK